ncbi:Palmitoyltransferase AKR1 [Phytophthora citrophthora]|uniref:Palmitoyltransferase AKR1 n=1 Tax=Phytophthora citrophthora TaxID=4793 RepID=A0AAD9LR86_9STRA|nr:Palmitoyltransferase AKR1 [Phytophthora citrophthora]
MEEDYEAVQDADGNGVYAYPEEYDVNYANYYQQQQEGDYYASYQQEGYEGYYYQQEDGQNGADQYSYDPNYTGLEGQEYNYYADQGYDVEQEAYTAEDGQQNYLDQLAVEQTTGYYYDDQGNLIEYAGAESPTNLFNQETYWEQDYNLQDAALGEQEETRHESEGLNPTELTPQTTDSVSTPEGNSTRKVKTEGKNGRASSPSRKKKTKNERIAQRQALLEKEEEERLKKEEAASINNNASGEGSAATANTTKVSKKKVGFVERGKAKFQMKLRIAKAIKRDRMPVQIRILPTTRKHLTPMDKYFGSTSVECVLSDIFWASIKGDINRVKHLVEVEGESPTDSKLDPWNLHQTPLHWAAKGGSVNVINYLLSAGASPRCLDENVYTTLTQSLCIFSHLSCWAGHVNASIMLLRASDAKDLYIQDYDGALCPLDWANVRGHTELLRAIEKYQDSLWLPKFVDDLIRGIIRYKIKIFKEPPKKILNAEAKEEAKDPEEIVVDQSIVADPTSNGIDKPDEETVESPAIAKKSLLKRSKTDQKLEKTNKAASSKSVG